MPYVSGIPQCLSCRDWLSSPRVMCSRFIHVVACARIPFRFQGPEYSPVWLYHVLSTWRSTGTRKTKVVGVGRNRRGLLLRLPWVGRGQTKPEWLRGDPRLQSTLCHATGSPFILPQIFTDSSAWVLPSLDLYPNKNKKSLGLTLAAFECPAQIK